MISKVMLGLGATTVVLSLVWMLFWKILPIGVNDAEWITIEETGLPSSPEELVWSDWKTDDPDSIDLFPVGTKSWADADLLSYRIGKADTAFLTFGFYQVRIAASNDTVETLPAYGPESWTHMKWSLPVFVCAIGLITMVGAALSRKRTQPKDRPLSSGPAPCASPDEVSS